MSLLGRSIRAKLEDKVGTGQVTRAAPALGSELGHVRQQFKRAVRLAHQRATQFSLTTHPFHTCTHSRLRPWA